MARLPLTQPMLTPCYTPAMPELPEVETVARGVAERVTGDVIESVWIGSKPEPLKSPAGEIASTLEGAGIARVRRVGKHIVIDLAAAGSRLRGIKQSRGLPHPQFERSSSCTWA